MANVQHIRKGSKGIHNVIIYSTLTCCSVDLLSLVFFEIEEPKIINTEENISPTIRKLVILPMEEL